ncbi:hypothetical protein EOA85_12405 [Mesorhizobium sp. M5C.F.Ca.IN.020.29.1.1]|nr:MULTISPECIES: hypothetical protein [unclassified Mesorhizobium]RUV59079.1 hypothetical protein EOA85_12405 [Mesorhizobium sp. M5C.F.Ca.IN.020.29.1.1]RWF11312.1 MAG: hypothetical protein EOS69_10545 [Mesorhizobium sp.]TIM90867.1 MAG: hypothetical protein E5Y50_01305 [Mesorhizobium sp.]
MDALTVSGESIELRQVANSGKNRGEASRAASASAPLSIGRHVGRCHPFQRRRERFRVNLTKATGL